VSDIIKESAFQSIDGEVVGTGPFHDITQLPENFQVQAEGFIDNKGNFVSREEAAKLVNQSGELRSEDLNKVQPGINKFPKLGLENRRETPIVAPKEAKTKNLLMANALKVKYPQTSSATKQAIKEKVMGDTSKYAGRTGPAGVPINVSYAVKGSGNKEIATKLHEDQHLLFNRVANKYGPKASINLAHNLYNSIPEQHRNSVQQYVSAIYGGKAPPAQKFHEEHIAHLVSYLNNPGNRKVFHQKIPGHWDPATNNLTDEGRTFQTSMKQAYRALQNASKQANEHWTKRVLKKSEYEDIIKNSAWQPTSAEYQAALNLTKIFDIDSPEFKAAKFLSNNYSPTPVEIESALQEYEGDLVAIALFAHHLPVNTENRQLIEQVAQLQDFNKSEDFDVAIIPRSVRPFREEDMFISDIIRQAFANNEIYPIKLDGKHSAGTAILKDHDNQTLWLLKPGSGHLSSALGVREESASQSRREVAFNHIAHLWGLGLYYPQAHLILLDGHEVAALEFFATDFTPLEKLKRQPGFNMEHLFERYVQNGLLYKWAFVDYVLAQADRHFGNVLYDIRHGFLKFIDAGSAFAGVSFDPAKDPKSFSVCYLRAFLPKKFRDLTPIERYAHFPRLPKELDLELKHWIDSLDERALIRVLNQFNINPDPIIDRLTKIRMYSGSKSEFLNKFWAGLDINL
jgi:hypothetical protein